MAERDAPRVTVLGLGRMGTAIARAFLNDGYRTTVWNRTDAKAGVLTAEGAVHADDVTAAVEAGPLLIVPLLDPGAVRQALEPAAPCLAGRTVVGLANGTPQQARDLAAWVAGHDADYLDGAMMALPHTVATPEAFFFYSGPERAYAEHRTALEVMAIAHHVGADPAAAEVHSLAVLGTGYAALTGFLHAAALLETFGTDPQTLAPAAAAWLRGMAAFLPELAGQAGSGRYGDAASTIDLNRPAVDALIAVSGERGVDPALHRPLKELLDRRSADGHGDDSFAAVYELLRVR